MVCEWVHPHYFFFPTKLIFKKTVIKRVSFFAIILCKINSGIHIHQLNKCIGESTGLVTKKAWIGWFAYLYSAPSSNKSQVKVTTKALYNRLRYLLSQNIN